MSVPDIDRTAKLYVGGKQARPDSGYSYTIAGPDGAPLGEAGLGSRKDIRNAVEAAAKASAWSAVTGHNRAQVLYYVAENLAARAAEFALRLRAMDGRPAESAEREVAAAIERTFWYAAWADKYDGQVHSTKSRHMTLAIPEAWGVMGIACPDDCTVARVCIARDAGARNGESRRRRALGASAARRDRLLPSARDERRFPAGVVNIVTGERDVLAKVLAQHDDVAAIWYFGTKAGSAIVQKASAGNLKASWVNDGFERDWTSIIQGQGREFLRHATQIKNIWAPYGD